MSELLEFFALLGAIYLLESFHKAGREGVFLFRLPFGKVKLTRTDSLLSGRGNVYCFGSIFPFADTFYLRFPSVSFSHIGIFPFFHHTINGRAKAASLHKALTYEEITDIKCEEQSVYVNGKLFHRSDSPSHADMIIDHINKLSERNELSRDNLLNDILNKEFSAQSVSDKLESYLKKTALLKIVVTAYFIYLFIIMPLLICFMDLAAIWPFLLSGIFLFNATVVFLFRRVHRFFYPGAYRERNLNTAIMALSPPVALRALDFISKDLFHENNYNVVATAMLPAEQTQKILALSYGDLVHPLEREKSQKFPEDYITIDYKSRYMKHFMEYVKKSGFSCYMNVHSGSVDEKFYCPRCYETYDLENLCANCGIKLNKIE